MNEKVDKFERKTPDQPIKVTDSRMVANTVEVDNSTDIIPAADLPGQMMLSAIKSGAGKETLDMLEKAFEFDLRVKAQQAKEEFFKAFSEFKQEEFTVLNDKINAMFQGRRFPSVGNFLGTVNPPLGRHGLSANFRIEDSDDYQYIRVVAVITHSKGHSIETGMSAEPDTKGPKGGDVKTVIHGRMSTVTHLMRTTFSAVTGVGSVDPEFDDDGNMAGGKVKEYINEDQQTVITDRINEIYSDGGKRFFKWMKIESVDQIPADKYKDAIWGLDDAANKKAEIEAKKAQREPGQEG